MSWIGTWKQHLLPLLLLKVEHVFGAPDLNYNAWHMFLEYHNQFAVRQSGISCLLYFHWYVWTFENGSKSVDFILSFINSMNIRPDYTGRTTGSMTNISRNWGTINVTELILRVLLSGKICYIKLPTLCTIIPIIGLYPMYIVAIIQSYTCVYIMMLI